MYSRGLGSVTASVVGLALLVRLPVDIISLQLYIRQGALQSLLSQNIAGVRGEKLEPRGQGGGDGDGTAGGSSEQSGVRRLKVR